MISLPDRAEQSDSNIASNNYDVPAHADDKSPEFRIAVRAHQDELKSKLKRMPCGIYARANPNHFIPNGTKQHKECITESRSHDLKTMKLKK